jgi:hypothetical protein
MGPIESSGGEPRESEGEAGGIGLGTVEDASGAAGDRTVGAPDAGPPRMALGPPALTWLAETIEQIKAELGAIDFNAEQQKKPRRERLEFLLREQAEMMRQQ